MGKEHQKAVTCNVWQDWVDEADCYLYAHDYWNINEAHKETIERVFTNEKENHGMGYIKMRGFRGI